MTDRKVTSDSDKRVSSDIYDRGIVPAETAARKDREGDKFKHLPDEGAQDDQSIDTMGGYTVDKEGLANNYAIEPEMYVEVPGDLRQEEEELEAERAQEYGQINQDEAGKLGSGHDERGRGSGII